MKNFCILLLCLFLAGCGDFVLKDAIVEPKLVLPIPEPVPEPVPEPKPDIEFMSITGERLEKYYKVIDPAIRDKLLPAISYVSGEDIPLNSLEINPIPYSTLYSGFPYTIHVSGQAAFKTQRYSGNIAIPSQFIFYFSFNQTVQLFSPVDINYDTLHEKYSVTDSFASESLALPKTAAYTAPYRDTLYKTITIPVSDSFLLHLTNEQPVNPNDAGISNLRPTTCAIPDSFSVEIFEPFVLQSRDFYQYKSITVKYAPDVRFASFVEDTDVVQRYEYNPSENSFTVYLKNYDKPFLGTVLTYSVQTDGIEPIEKKLTIE